MENELLTHCSHGVLPQLAPDSGIRERLAKTVSVLNEYLAKGYSVYGESGFPENECSHFFSTWLTLRVAQVQIPVMAAVPTPERTA